ncbi:hypothetical protein EST38_g8679 [Candolleomyces aberdarensis]|uniref:Uncharacterized protein n=1 Tax=Candolleomyces aberdarensis TaxID=2316362 RepID=A0A4Q2DE71_9AGAR|nr:hypothetical protein EST38_g8679 [Candolleomyces aberdarensis]
MPRNYPPVFSSWFTKPQREWLDQLIGEYVDSINKNTTVPFLMAVVEHFSTLYPIRRTRRLSALAHDVKVNTIRIRIRAYLSFSIIDATVNWRGPGGRRIANSYRSPLVS